MAKIKELKELFNQWNELNTHVGDSFQEFDFPTLREFREKQRNIEDSIFDILKETAPKEIKEILPDNCGEMELGYDNNKNIFYFLMEDPEQGEEEDLKILAITLDSENNIEIIKNFKNDIE
ncbi:MAG: hypothetical protein JXA99_03230 [Candidatus Lokiarchaeota archaeon]|nr:hypothetical protein [Candidatus Lokiarchaeota archaeon]